MTEERKKSIMRQFLKSLEGQTAPTDAPSDRRVIIVSGAPGAGKTTYVHNAKKSGDLVIDLDLIAAALQGSKSTHPDYSPVMDEVMLVRDSLYETIAKRGGKWNTAYVITSTPDSQKISDLAGRLHGEIVSLPASRQECISRLQNDTTRSDLERDITLVNQWFDAQEIQNL